VHDSRKRKITDLWLRGTRYCAHLRMDTGDGRTAPRRVPLSASTAFAYGVAGLALIAGIALFFRSDYRRNQCANSEMINNLATVRD
jgi:hypothetical protein